MCGRYFLTSPTDRVVEQFVIREFFEGEAGPSPRPRYNIAPSQHIPVVRRSRESGDRKLESMQWGLVPAWAKDPDGGPRPINARGEDAAGKPYFRNAMKQRRCLIPADGFYEWKKSPDNPKARKQPYAIRMADESLFAMAGLWECWQGGEGERPRITCTILTTRPNALMKGIHDRMPVVVDHADYARWLDADANGPGDVADLLEPFPADRMRATAVSPRVNSPKNDDEACLEPADVGLFD